MTRFWRLIVIRACQTKIRNLQDSSIVDEQVGGLHISMENLVLVQVPAALEQLLHVAFDLWDGEMHIGIFKQARQVVVHVGCHHEHARLFARVFRAFDGHFLQFQDIDVVKLL